MNIGFDLDKVFIDYPPIIPNWIIDRLYKKKSNGTLLYRIPGKLEEKLRIISHSPYLRPLISPNYNFVKELSKDKNKHLFLISSRFGFLKKQTDALIEKHTFNTIFARMFFNYKNEQPHLFKSAILGSQKIQQFIDDDLPLLRFLAKKHNKIKFFWLNKNAKGKILDNLFAITKISQMLD